MLQLEKPEDLVIATGVTTSVRKFVEMCAQYIDMDMVWEGEGEQEKGIDRKTGKVVVRVDPKYYRPAEVDLLVGDASRAKELLGWEPKIQVEELVQIMMQHDLREAEQKAKYENFVLRSILRGHRGYGRFRN